MNAPNALNKLNAINDMSITNATNPMNKTATKELVSPINRATTILRHAPRPLLPANEAGQAMVEYLLATVLAALVIGAAFAIFFSALRGYYGLLTFLIGLPVP